MLYTAAYRLGKPQTRTEQRPFTMRSGELTGNDTGGASHVAAAHYWVLRWRLKESSDGETLIAVQCGSWFTLLRFIHFGKLTKLQDATTRVYDT